MEIIETAWIPLTDGTRLAARLFLPDARPAPAVLEFLPYRRRDGTAARDEGTYPAYAQAGIAGVRVDLRGTGDSEGHFDDEYSEREMSDAEAVIAWIAAQSWSNGNVGMMGISWGGFNALQLAARRPPALKAVISIASTVDRFADDIHFKGGACMSSNLYWATQMLGRAALPPDPAVVGPDWRANWLNRLEHVPALAAQWHREHARGPYWQHGSVCEDFGAIDIPCLVIAGWADGYRNTPWKARAGLGDKVRAITGPWVHLYPHLAAPHPTMDFLRESTAWWHAYLATGPVPDLPPHRLWLSEAVRPGPRDHEPGRWIAIDQNPAMASRTVATINATTAHLCLQNTPPGGPPEAHSGAAAAGSVGTGDESRRATGNTPLRLKTPGHCGAHGGEYFTQSPTDLPGDQRPDDALSACFDTAPLSAPLDIIGMPELTLPVSLDAPRGTLIARLCDVHPDGTSHRITLGVLNLCHRSSAVAPTPMTPGTEETVTITLDATAYRLPKGHRLRLALSTNYFPLVLPPPAEVTATIDLARTTLMLPSHPFEEITLAEGADTRPAYERQTPAKAERVIADGTVSVTATAGRLCHPENGMIWQDTRQSDWAVGPGVVTGKERCAGMRLRDGVEMAVEATAELTTTESEWIISCRLTATENGKEIFARSWSDRIARQHG